MECGDIKIEDQNYKSPKALIHYLVKAAGKNANLLMNIGPQPNGELPATAVDRLKKWANGWTNTEKLFMEHVVEM